MRLRNWLGNGLGNGIVALVLVTVLVGGACGKSKSSSGGTTATTAAQVACATGTVAGAGSTFVQTIAQQWIKDFTLKCPGATINYQGVGSGAGITQFIAGTVDFAGSDAVMKPEEETAAMAKGGGSPLVYVPWSAGGIAVEFHLTGVTALKLSPETLAGIFAGTVKTWNAAEVKADNGGATLPSTPIQIVHRSDGSGTTNAFTSYLTAVAPTIWKAGKGKDVPWPAGQGAKGSDGVTATVKQTDGAIGYAELSYAKASGLGVAAVKNPSGAYVMPDADSVAAALSEATTPADLKIVPNFKPTGANAYPISIPTWAITFQKPADAAKGKLLKAFLAYAVGPGQLSAKSLYYAPLPTALQDKVKAAVESIQA